jgi:hypothetical protein
MAPRSDNISEISPVKESWSIVVRIVRAWFVRDVNRDAHSCEHITLLFFYY